MKIKHLLIAILSLAGCSGGGELSSPSASSPREATFTVNAVSDFHSKSGLAEGVINRTSVWIYASKTAFQSGQQAQAFGYSEGSSVTLQCPVGTKYVLVLVNIPSEMLSGDNPVTGGNLDFNFEGRYCTLEQMSSDGILMRGDLSNVTVADGGSRTVTVTRSIAKISVGQITNAIEEEPWNSMTLYAESIYILNGVGRVPLTGTVSSPAVEDFFCCSAQYDPAVGPYPDFGQMAQPEAAKVSISTTITHYGYINPTYALYTGPNPVSTEISTDLGTLSGLSSWSVRRTRLVIECRMDNYQCYYPLTLPVLQENTWYKINDIRLKHFGSSSPDSPLSFTAAEVDATLSSWDGVAINETI